MFGKTAIRVAVMVFVIAVAGIAQGQDKIQNYVSDAAIKAKATTDPVQKREILNKSFESMVTALNRVQGSPLVSSEDKAGLEHYKVILKDKQDELAGTNGYQRVSDAQLDAFANYSVQDMEQAAQTVTISVVTLLLVLIIVILLL